MRTVGAARLGHHGLHDIDQVPTAAEAETIHHYVGVAKKREMSEVERERLTSLGRRFETLRR